MLPEGLEFSFWKSAAKDRDRVVLVEDDGTEHTAGALVDAANQIARNLASRGLEPGDVVAMVLHNEAAVYELNLAVMQSGLYLVPVNWHLTAHEIGYILEDSGAKAAFVSSEFTELVPAWEFGVAYALVAAILIASRWLTRPAA